MSNLSWVICDPCKTPIEPSPPCFTQTRFLQPLVRRKAGLRPHSWYHLHLNCDEPNRQAIQSRGDLPDFLKNSRTYNELQAIFEEDGKKRQRQR